MRSFITAKVIKNKQVQYFTLPCLAKDGFEIRAVEKLNISTQGGILHLILRIWIFQQCWGCSSFEYSHSKDIFHQECPME